MIHLVYLHPHFTVQGGAGRYVLETGRRLAERGYRVSVVTITAAPEIVDQYRDCISFIEIKGPLTSSLAHWLMWPLFLLRLFMRVRALQPDILFPQVFPSNWWGFLCKFLMPRTPLVWMCQEPSAFIHSRTWIEALPDGVMKFLVKALNPVLKVIDRVLSRQADRVLVNSRYGKEYALSVYPYASEQIQVTYLGFDERAFSPDAATPKEKTVITVGRLTRFKNIDVLLDAAAVLRGEGVDFTVTIVGRGEAEDELKARTRELNLEAVVEFAGGVSAERLTELLRRAKVLVLGSVDEPFGLVAVEAMACGTPVVAVRSGGPSETVLDGESGYLIPGRDPNALAAKLRAILLDAAVSEKLSAGALRRSRSFTWEETVAVTDRAFKEIRYA